MHLVSLDGVAYGFCFAVFVDIVVVLTGVLGQHLRYDVGKMATKNRLRSLAH